jgi:hypothetical protein
MQIAVAERGQLWLRFRQLNVFYKHPNRNFARLYLFEVRDFVKALSPSDLGPVISSGDWVNELVLSDMSVGIAMLAIESASQVRIEPHQYHSAL